MTNSGHIFGFNWLKYHEDMADLAFMAQFRPASLTLYEWMWSNEDWCKSLLAYVPSSTVFLLRDHPMSEQKSDIYTSPAATGRRHSDEWKRKWEEGRIHIPLERAYIEGGNELDSNLWQKAIDVYTHEFTWWNDDWGARTAGWVFGTGHPSTVNLDPKKEVDWHWYAESADSLYTCNGIANFHAYGSYNDMPWKDHLARMATCPYALKCIISEFGIDEGIKGNAGQGWAVNLQPEAYVEWLDRAQVGVREALQGSKLELLSLEIFSYDTNSDWKTFDVRGMRDKLLAKQWGTPVVMPSIPSIPNEVHVINLPFVTYHQQPLPDDLPEEDRWEKSIAFVLGEEGGFSSDPDDPGNWRDGQFVGTKFGISGAVWGGSYDIQNLTLEQAKEIYKKHYWEGSKADRMPWPYCLLHFDAAVQHGVGTATWMNGEAKGNLLLYLAIRDEYYANIKTWDRYGKAWALRMANLERVMAGG